MDNGRQTMIQSGDRVKIIKPQHPAEGCAGVVLGPEQLDDGTPVMFVASTTPHDGKQWPVFVLRLEHLELIGGRQSIEPIIDACEARGCPLRGLYKWAGPYRPPNWLREITG